MTDGGFGTLSRQEKKIDYSLRRRTEEVAFTKTCGE
jgi:hypothetical protein